MFDHPLNLFDTIGTEYGIANVLYFTLLYVYIMYYYKYILFKIFNSH